MLVMPVLMLPVVMDPFGWGKNWLLMALAVVGMVIWVVEMLVNRKTEIKVNKTMGLTGLLIVWAWAGWIFKLTVGERMRSITDLGGVGTLTAIGIWLFLWQQTINKEERRVQLNWLTVTGMVVLVTSLVAFLIPTSKLPIVWPTNNPIVSINAGWSLTGSLLSEAVLMVFLLLEWGKRLVDKLSAKQNPDPAEQSYLVEAAVTGLLSLALMLAIFRIFKTGWVVLDGLSAWVIAAEAFKQSPIWGVGAGNFVRAFTAFRPDSYNLTAYWAGGFKASSMGILQLWTELGTIGLVLTGLIAGMVLKTKKNWEWAKLVILGLGVAFLPENIEAVLLVMWLMTEVVESKKINLSFKVGENGFNAAPWIMAVVIMVSSVFGGYWMGRILLGDFYMRQSMVAAAKNDGSGTYNLQIQVIAMDPYLGDYHQVYSQTNLALAGGLLSNKDISDDDKQKASVLIQQAVREAKTAIALEPNNPAYWSNLAVIYRQLVGVVDGSADWSFQAYQQAVALEPANPMSKLEMGGLLYAANKFDEADRVFEQVVTVKPDYANGWYNWAYSAKQLNNLDNAVARLTQAVALVPAGSGDYDKANQELTDLKKQLDEANKSKAAATVTPTPSPTPETLKTQEPLPTGSKKKTVAVPSGDLAPPSVEVTPTVSPAP